MPKGYHTWPIEGTLHPVGKKHKKNKKKNKGSQRRKYDNYTYQEGK